MSAHRAAWPGRLGMEAGASVRPTERRISHPAATGRRTEGAIPRLRVADVWSPRAAYRAVPGASSFLQTAARIRPGAGGARPLPDYMPLPSLDAAPGAAKPPGDATLPPSFL